MGYAFISYSSKNQLMADAFRNLLNSKGIDTWMAPGDIPAGSSYMKEINNALKNCSCLVLLLSNAAQGSEWVIKEVERAVNYHKIIIPIKIEDVILNDEFEFVLCSYQVVAVHKIDYESDEIKKVLNSIKAATSINKDNLSADVLISKKENNYEACQDIQIGQQHWTDAVTPPLEAHIMTLVDTVKDCLSSNGQIPQKINRPMPVLVTNDQVTVVNSLAYPDSDFVGRSDELEKLNSILSGCNNKVFLVGMGGLGKSQIAKKYLQEHINDYSNIVWIPFEKNLAYSIGDDNKCPMTDISRVYYPNDTDDEYGLRKIDVLKRIADKNVLIIIDNFDVEDDPYLERFLSGSYSIIFTTRIQHSGRNEIPIEPINDETTLFELFFKDYKREVTPQDRITIKRIIDYLEGHTLSVRLVAGEMQNNRIRPEKMLGLLKKENTDGRNINKKVSERIASRLKSIFSLTMLSDDEKHLLMNLSLFPNSGIEVPKLYEWCGYEDYEIINGLIARSWIIYDDRRDVVHLHPLIAEIMLEELNKYPDVCGLLLMKFYEEYKWNIQYPASERIRIRELSNAIYERVPINSQQKLNILMIRVIGLYYLSQYQKGFDDCKTLIDSGISFEQKLFGYVRLCHGLTLSGFYEKAVKIGSDGKMYIENKDIFQCSRYEAYLFRNLIGHYAEALYHCNAPEEAYKEFQYIYQLSDNIYKNTPQETKGWSEFHLTQCLVKLNRFDEAEEMTEKCITHFEECSNAYGISFGMWNKAYLLAKKGEYPEAEKCIEKTLELLLSIVGEDNVDIAKTYHFQSKVRIFAHDAQGAIESLDNAKLIYEKLNFSTFASMTEKDIARLKAGEFWEPDILL